MNYFRLIKVKRVLKSHFVLKLFFILCFFALSDKLTIGQVTDKEIVTIDDAVNKTLRIKYSKILGIQPDSICCISMYDIIDKWPAYIQKNPAKTQFSTDGVFIQYVYYLVYTTKLPSAIPGLYIHEKAYPFKNSDYLRTGDLVFYDFKSEKPSKVAIYLQDNRLAIAASNGDLKFIRLMQLKETGELHYAKIIKDEEGTSQ